MNRRRMIFACSSGAAFAVMALTACSAPVGHSGLETAKDLIESCPDDVSYADDVRIDATGSSKSNGLDEGRLEAIAGVVSRAAACGGRVRISAFASSSASSATVFEGAVPLVGATTNAKARRLDKAVNEVLEKVKHAWSNATESLDANGSDIVAQLRLSSEWAAQIGGDHRLRLLVLTDGFQTAGRNVTDPSTDPTTAAASFAVPNLSGAAVTIAGIGMVDGAAPATELVDRVKMFYDVLCERTGAASCTVVTDVPGRR